MRGGSSGAGRWGRSLVPRLGSVRKQTPRVEADHRQLDQGQVVEREDFEAGGEAAVLAEVAGRVLDGCASLVGLAVEGGCLLHAYELVAAVRNQVLDGSLTQRGADARRADAAVPRQTPRELALARL